MPRPVRSLTLTAKLKDASNVSAPELSFQRKAVQDFHAARQVEGQASLTASEDASGPSLSARPSFTGSHISLSTASTGTPHKKRAAPSVPDDSDEEGSLRERGTFFF
jgi:hypothetical protein